MEAWNPDDGTVQTLSDVLPPEEGKSSGLETSQLIAINDGSELLLFNTYAEGGIWKFSMLEKSTKVETSKKRTEPSKSQKTDSSESRKTETSKS